MNIKEGYLSFKEYKTYYRIVSPEYKKTPLLILHGGPGSNHNSYEVLDELSVREQRPIVMYDQIGCGNSYLEGHEELWKADTWLDELAMLRKELKLDNLFIMGHSWGGMLAIMYMIDKKPEGVRGLILSSTLSSVTLWEKETRRLTRFLSDSDKKAIEECEKRKDYSCLEYQLALSHYANMFIGSKADKNSPECLRRKSKKGPESYRIAWGESEFCPTGNLNTYEYTDRLKDIKVPVLLTSGINDESTPLINKTMFDAMTSEKKWVLFGNSRHMSYVEENKKYEEEISEFMDQYDKGEN